MNSSLSKSPEVYPYRHPEAVTSLNQKYPLYRVP
jgi:hypothetical protein